ncbi:MAG: glycoside hydrolase family 2 protein, partial [Erysipelotrichaceae bacterium]|nr:glycoside hydrolase family 2 protein [Erysipelotrichaceae bacterium]
MNLAINNDWRFIRKWDDSFIKGRIPKGEKIRIPHSVNEFPLHYIDDKSYQMISAYYKRLEIPAEAKNKRVFINFEGAGHIATVYVNGNELATHLGGYTAFRVEITKYIKGQSECDLLVKLDSTENGKIPPFGFVIDYLTYGGIYRPVSMEIEEKTYIEDLYITTPEKDTVSLKMKIDGKQDLSKTIRISDKNGELAYETKTDKDELTFKVDGVKQWDLEDPELYYCEVILSNKATKKVRFGFRTIRYERNSFYLNDKKVIMRGLDRHQCYPYTGYAVSDSLQKEDARILKEELSCNAVRTSHYPQSQAFIDACDELGLLVFTEIPGWQHIGDKSWQDVACKHTEEMVLQYRNHPSIVLWGVRINESQDDDELYIRTNKIAHELDPSRPTSGVRYITKSSLLEDVYAFNDFIHEGGKQIIRKKSEISPDQKKPLLISEANGHMFPTKSFDKWIDREEHAIRHARVMNAALGSGEHIGVFQWCMFDYPTHKDFGSSDRVCYHGVMDAFRNPKPAAYVYACQEDNSNILELSSSLDIGDYPRSQVASYYVYSNADSVRLYKNDAFVKEYTNSPFKALKHGPILINDTVGELLKTQEGFEGEKEQLIHDILLSMMKYGHINLPL